MNYIDPTKEALLELSKWHDNERERLWNAGEQAQAIQHGKWSVELTVAANNWKKPQANA